MTVPQGRTDERGRGAEKTGEGPPEAPQPKAYAAAAEHRALSRIAAARNASMSARSGARCCTAATSGRARIHGKAAPAQ